MTRNACEKFSKPLNYYKIATCSVPLLAGVGIFFFITLKQSYSAIFQMSSWGKKKKSETSKFDRFLPVGGNRKQSEVSLHKVSGALQHKGYLGKGEQSVLVQPRAHTDVS